MKAAVITFPGSNNDDDCRYVLGQIHDWSVDSLWHREKPSLSDYQLIVLPGGFSFGDYLRTGAVASVSPIMESVKEFADRGGYVLGTCNGFQILCESGLLPGALARNNCLHFLCQDVFLKVETSDRPWTQCLEKHDIVRFPIAHGEGRYVADESTLQKLKENDQILLRYCDKEGLEGEEFNPNGSAYNIAGICNESGNVFGLMPHPERATDLRSKQGWGIWKSILQEITKK